MAQPKRTPSSFESTAARAFEAEKQPAQFKTDLDQFKFRLAEENGFHFFREVSFKSPDLSKDDQQTVVNFFEGQCLQRLGAEELNAYLGHLTFLPGLEKFVLELKELVGE